MTDSPGNRRPILDLVREAMRKARARGLDLVQLVELVQNHGWPEADVRIVIAGLVAMGELELQEVEPEQRTRQSPFPTWTRIRLVDRGGRVKLEDAQFRDDLLQAEVDRWQDEEDALRSVVSQAAALYESYRGGPFGVCQRTVRDVERGLFFFAQAAKVRFLGDNVGRTGQ